MLVILAKQLAGDTSFGYSLKVISPENGLKPIGYFFIIVFFNLLSVRLDILFSNWYNTMKFTTRNERKGILATNVCFLGTCGVHVINVLLTYYLTQRFTIQWRTWLNEKMLGTMD